MIVNGTEDPVGTALGRAHAATRNPHSSHFSPSEGGIVGLILTLQKNETNILAVSLALLAGIQEEQAATNLFPGPDYVAPGRASS
jgi:hypothetical protein